MAADPPAAAARLLGVELRRLRRERGLAQRDLRKPLRLASHSAIVEFELGRRIPSQDILAAYERHFSLAPGELRRLRQAALTERAATEAQHAMATGNGAAEVELLDRQPQAEPAVPALTSAISGIGGVGRTALSVHWEHTARDRCPDGMLLVLDDARRILIDLLAPADARLLLRRIIGPERAGPEPGAVALMAEIVRLPSAGADLAADAPGYDYSVAGAG